KMTFLQSLKGSCTMIIRYFYRLPWFAIAKKCIVGISVRSVRISECSVGVLAGFVRISIYSAGVSASSVRIHDWFFGLPVNGVF
ncbi:MAG TPA: hypothetical protein VHO70_02160, partial [Chitinispirillaceae bacterium]|nr:hypothetical protein [Chitinispirillaceae bacterium]